MAGILQQAAQAAPPAEPMEEEMPPGEEEAEVSPGGVEPQGEAMEGEAPDEQLEDGDLPEGMEDATPEEQEMFERGKAVGLKLLTQKGALDRLIDVIRKQGLPGIASMIASMVARIDEKMDLPETVILPVATELTGFVMDAAERARVVKVDQDSTQKVLSGVYQALAQLYGQTPEDAKEAIEGTAPEQGNGTVA